LAGCFAVKTFIEVHVAVDHAEIDRVWPEKEKPPGLFGGFSENLNLRLSTGLECEAGFSGY